MHTDGNRKPVVPMTHAQIRKAFKKLDNANIIKQIDGRGSSIRAKKGNVSCGSSFNELMKEFK